MLSLDGRLQRRDSLTEFRDGARLLLDDARLLLDELLEILAADLPIKIPSPPMSSFLPAVNAYKESSVGVSALVRQNFQGAEQMKEKKFPHYSNSVRTGDRGVRLVEGIITDEYGWLFREQENQQKDFGIDAHVELLDNERNVLGKLLAFQIKTGPSYFNRKNSDGFVFSAHKPLLNYYLNYPFSVILILCDDRFEKCWWCKVDPLQTEETKRGRGWQITVPFEQELNLAAKSSLARLAGPARDHLPSMEHYWIVNSIMQEHADSMHVIIARADVESANIFPTLECLNRILVTKNLALRYKQRVALSFHGYDEDPRELFEIYEVKNWIYKMTKEFPYWFFFLSIETSGLALIAHCFSDAKIVGPGKVTINNELFRQFLEYQFMKMNEMCDRFGVNFQENVTLTERITRYFTSDEGLYC